MKVASQQLIVSIRKGIDDINNKSKEVFSNMIDAINKGIEKAKVEVPAVGKYEGVDLSKLPSFICYKSVLLKEKLLWQNVSVILLCVLSLLYVVNRNQINKLTKQYREKEYIVLPDHIPVSPHTISDSYVKDAVDTFLSLLGNINSKDIEKQYEKLSSNMSLDLKRRFEEQTYEWKEYVTAENITEILKCGKQEIYSNDKGQYEVTALCKKETYVNHEYIGAVDEVVEMKLAAVAPNKKKRWVVNITDLKRTTKKAFKVKTKL